MEEKTISIEGMTCASCVARVEKALISVEGIDTASVNLISNNAKLVYNPSLVSEKKIVKAVEKAGYKASLDVDLLSFMQNKRLIDMKRRFIFSLVLSIPVFVFAMGHMFPFNIWFPAFAGWQQEFIIFSGTMRFSDFLQLILTTPIQFVISFPFYKAAWNSLRNKSASMDVLIVIGTLAAYFYSLFSVIYKIFNPAFMGAVFFETAAIITS
jgi:Cu+-exporting ATPase